MITAAHNQAMRRAFSLVEIIIVTLILGILAALVVPRFSNASSTARANSLKVDLRHFRTQVMVYKAQHDVAPGYPNGDPTAQPSMEALIAQLTQFTNEQGQTSASPTAEHRFGPYLPHLPVNAINGSAQVKFVADGASLPASPSGEEGWLYQPSTATVLVNSPGKDEDGKAYFDY